MLFKCNKVKIVHNKDKIFPKYCSSRIPCILEYEVYMGKHASEQQMTT